MNEEKPSHMEEWVEENVFELIAIKLMLESLGELINKLFENMGKHEGYAKMLKLQQTAEEEFEARFRKKFSETGLKLKKGEIGIVTSPINTPEHGSRDVGREFVPPECLRDSEKDAEEGSSVGEIEYSKEEVDKLCKEIHELCGEDSDDDKASSSVGNNDDNSIKGNDVASAGGDDWGHDDKDFSSVGNNDDNSVKWNDVASAGGDDWGHDDKDFSSIGNNDDNSIKWNDVASAAGDDWGHDDKEFSSVGNNDDNNSMKSNDVTSAAGDDRGNAEDEMK